MAKIAVYDRFYKNNYPGNDIVAEALRGSEHDIVARSWRIREAVTQILGFANGAPDDRPNIVILGGRLEDDPEYKRNPLTVSEPCRISRRTWFGRTKEIDGQRTTFILPQFESDGRTYQFPTIEDIAPKLPDEVAEQWRYQHSGVAAAILSSVTETYLPDTKRIGISSDPVLLAELDGKVLRGVDAVHLLREQIERLADAN